MGIDTESGFDVDMGFGSRGSLEDMENVGALDQVVGETSAEQAVKPDEPSSGILAGAKYLISKVNETVVQALKNSSIDFN